MARAKISCLVMVILSLSSTVFASETSSTLARLKAEAAQQSTKSIPEHRTDGIYLKSPFQAMEAQVSAQGVVLHSLAAKESGHFSLTPVSYGKGPQQKVQSGEVVITGERIELRRNGIFELFSNSMDGIRQDFLIHHKPEGHEQLSLSLALAGAEASGGGQEIKLTTATGRELVYSQLHITDANGKVLSGQMQVLNASTVQIRVDDSQARYPLLIDPTYTDADWRALGTGLNGGVSALTVFNGALIAAGSFTTAGGVTVNRIARWDGTNWSALGTGVNAAVNGLGHYNGDLIAVGTFTTAGGITVNRIARWDGSNWFALGSGLSATANTVTVYNGNLIVGGSFATAGGLSSTGVASWNGSSWTAWATGLISPVNVLKEFNGKLIVGGGFTTVGGMTINRIASWDGTNWAALGSGLNAAPIAMAIFDNKLIVGGSFTTAGGASLPGIASWDGSNWSGLGTGMNNSVRALAEFNGSLFVAGVFTSAGGLSAGLIASWNGTSWSVPVTVSSTLQINALATFDDSLIVGGTFTSVAGSTASPYIVQLKQDRVSLTFDSQGGTAVGALTAYSGDTVVLPANPSRTNYTFTGWNSASDGSGTHYGSENSSVTMPVGGAALYAQWILNQYTLTFDSNGGSAVAAITADFGASVSIPADPVRSGYSFVGWTPSIPQTMPATDTTVTAQWSANQYTLTFNSNGGSAVAAITADFGASVSIPADPVRSGYSFVGWTPSIPQTMPATDTTVTAQWSANQYTLTFDSNGGSAVAVITGDFGVVVSAPADPVRSGYSFIGWTPSIPQTMPATDTTFTAQWLANQYTLAFDSNGGSAVAAITADFGVAVSAPADPVRSGYSFSGWSPAVPQTVPAANTIYTAQWDSLQQYTLKFNSNGGSEVAPIIKYAGEAVSAPANPMRAGYRFAGWNPVVPTTMPAANTILTAQWDLDQFTLRFDSNGGSAVAPITADYGSAVSAPEEPARTGYIFAGWRPEVPQTMPAADFTFIAQWAVPRYTLSFDSNGGSAVEPITAEAGIVINPPAPPVRRGHHFIGWLPEVPQFMPAEDLQLTAQYEPIQLTVSATVFGDATISPISQQVNYGSSAIINLNLSNTADVVVLTGSCQAALSNGQIVTSAVTEACDIEVTVYPYTELEKDTEAALASHSSSRFRFAGGAGTKVLRGASVQRSGVLSELALKDAEALIALQDDGSYLFSAQRTGMYTLEFVDTVSGERIFIAYNVAPYLAFTSSQQPVSLNVPVTVTVQLSDEPVEYPVTAELVQDGVTSEVQQIQLSAEHRLLRTYGVTAVATSAQLSMQNTDISNALLGTPAVHSLAVQEQPLDLALTAQARQNGLETFVIEQTGGSVSLSASERNTTPVTYSWSVAGLALRTNGDTASFDPEAIAEGLYTITVTAQSEDGRTGQYDLALRIVADCPVSSCAGAGTSGIPVSQNSQAETPNRLPLCPAIIEGNRVAACSAVNEQELYVEVPKSYQLRLGSLAEEQSWQSGQFGIALNDNTLADPGFVQQGAVIDFEVHGLVSSGEVVSVALPLSGDLAIPPNAVWRKHINGQWQDFVQDAVNQISSAARYEAGRCPEVTSDRWTAGLTAGHGCVRLTIQDGGPNDHDGTANFVIRDPGVLAVADVVTPVPVKDDAIKSGGSIGFILTLVLGCIAGFRLRKLVFALVAVLPFTVLALRLDRGKL